MKRRTANKILNNLQVYMRVWAKKDKRIAVPKNGKCWYLIIKAATELHRRGLLMDICEQFKIVEENK